MEIYRPVWVEVDLNALARNYERIIGYAGGEVMPIVKADAYGHGVIPLVRKLRECGAKRFGVALLEEALEIKKVFPDLELMVIGVTKPAFSDVLVKEDIIPGIFRLEQAKDLSEAAVAQGKTARLHFKIDTGMGRVGFRPEQISEILQAAALPNLAVEGIYMHFASADQRDLTFAHVQLQRFNDVYKELADKGLRIPIRHAANSAAILVLPESHFERVRPGIILYGLPPSNEVGAEAQMEPVLSWKAEISHIKTIKVGESVSYGQTYRAKSTTVVATMPVGYADGLRRSLSNGGEVLVRGRRVKIIGRVCMDQTMLDVTAVPEVKVGDRVTLIGGDGDERIEAADMGAAIGTINYEVVCGISKRVPRVYLD